MKPTFEELAKLRDSLVELQSLVAALADEEDSIQRATDLFGTTKDFDEQVTELLSCYWDIDEWD